MRLPEELDKLVPPEAVAIAPVSREQLGTGRDDTAQIITTKVQVPELADKPGVVFTPDHVRTGLWGPAGMPKEVVDKLNAALEKIVADPAIVKRFEELGIAPVKATPAEYADLVARQAADWAPIIKPPFEMTPRSAFGSPGAASGPAKPIAAPAGQSAAARIGCGPLRCELPAADELLRRLSEAPAVRIVVSRVQGSGPREAGAWMAVFDDAVGSIGGGKLEFDAVADACALLAGRPVAAERRFALGPSLGQCCGGVVWLRYELLQPADTERVRAELLEAMRGHMPVALFGGGHVGLAIVSLLGALPVRTHWIDSREESFHRAAAERALRTFPSRCMARCPCSSPTRGC
jgi:hypothetical protein